MDTTNKRSFEEEKKNETTDSQITPGKFLDRYPFGVCVRAYPHIAAFLSSLDSRPMSYQPLVCRRRRRIYHKLGRDS